MRDHYSRRASKSNGFGRHVGQTSKKRLSKLRISQVELEEGRVVIELMLKLKRSNENEELKTRALGSS